MKKLTQNEKNSLKMEKLSDKMEKTEFVRRKIHADIKKLSFWLNP